MGRCRAVFWGEPSIFSTSTFIRFTYPAYSIYRRQRISLLLSSTIPRSITASLSKLCPRFSHGLTIPRRRIHAFPVNPSFFLSYLPLRFRLFYPTQIRVGIFIELLFSLAPLASPCSALFPRYSFAPRSICPPLSSCSFSSTFRDTEKFRRSSFCNLPCIEPFLVTRCQATYRVPSTS